MPEYPPISAESAVHAAKRLVEELEKQPVDQPLVFTPQMRVDLAVFLKNFAENEVLYD